ncbi:MAG: hypothetical protein ACOZCL_16060 [Bacillota bacterium]
MDSKKNITQNCCTSENKKITIGKKHGILMMLCCIAPIAFIGIMAQVSPKAWSLGSLAFIICPILHVGMMVFMMKTGIKHTCHSSKKEPESAGINE